MPDITSDYPGAAALQAAGITTTEAAEALSRDDLLKIPGIGPSTADKILTPGGSNSAETQTQDPAKGDNPAPEVQPQPVNAAEAAPEVTYDTTIRGGRYVVDGQLVNAKGKRIDATGKQLEPDDPEVV